MMHTRRRWNVSTRPASPDELAEMLTGRTWTLCHGVRIGRALWLNDSTSEDAVQEYAVLDAATLEQIESVTVSWCSPDKLAAYLAQSSIGALPRPWPFGSIRPAQIAYDAPYPHCRFCR